MKRPDVNVGDHLEITLEDRMADAEDDQEIVEMEVLTQNPMCWHFTARDVVSGRHFSLFMEADGSLWTKEFFPAEPELNTQNA